MSCSTAPLPMSFGRSPGELSQEMLNGHESLRDALFRYCEVQFKSYTRDANENISKESMDELVQNVCKTLHLTAEDTIFPTKVEYSFSDVQDVVSKAMHAQLTAELGILKEERQTLIKGISNTKDAIGASAKPSLWVATVKKNEGQVKVLDVGSGEVGFNTFELINGVVKMTNEKKKCEFIKEHLEADNTENFANIIFEMWPNAKTETIYVGFTGANREDYLKNPERFQAYCEKLKSKLNIEWFVPSGAHEAEMELGAVKYLSKQNNIERVDGVIAGGGGSCQISHCFGSATNVFSIPLGNKTPEDENKVKLCGETARDKLMSWICVLGLEIGKLKMIPMPGTFVGISAMFYGAKEAGIEDKEVTKLEAITAIDKKLNTLTEKMMTEEATDEEAKKARKNDEKAMYNLGMMRALFQSLLKDEAKILCQRNWKIGEEKLVATWSLGLYVKEK